MPKGQYTRGRLIMLQLIMWIIFGMCMGMAALVTAKHRSTYHVELSEPVKVGPFKAQLPKGWKITTNTRTQLASVEASEPPKLTRGRAPRHVKVFVERLDDAMFPQVYLRRSPVVEFVKQQWNPLTYGLPKDRIPGGADRFEPYSMAGTEGVQVGKIDPDGNVFFFACAVVPDPDKPPIHWAVTVRLMCDESISPGDRAVFRQVAESISLTKN
jgi:hypothetical protein